MRPTRRLLIAAGVLVLLAALLLATCLPAPLAPQAALAAAVPHALPAASPPPEMALYQLPTAVIPRNAAVAYRGGSPRDKRMFAMTAVLVRHPRGDLLIDTGLGRGVEVAGRGVEQPGGPGTDREDPRRRRDSRGLVELLDHAPCPRDITER